MTKSTAPVEPVDLHSSPSAYYLWEFPEKPVSVRLSLDVVDRLERDVLESFRAITARGSEVGGLLLGRTEAGDTFKTVVENYELIHCDYTRGPLYLLSDEEKVRMEEAIRRKKAIPGQSGGVVGFFRSNTRKDLALDEEDLETFGKYFSRPEQVFLLVKPFAAKASMGGLFIWEGGRVRGEGSYIEFPFRRGELGKGEFAKSIVIDAPKPKEPAPEPAAPAPVHKTGSRAQVLPFALKRDEEPPVPAPPLKREERAPVVALNPKADVEEAPVRAAAPKSAPPLPPLREPKKESPKTEPPAVALKPARPVKLDKSEKPEQKIEKPEKAEKPEKIEKAEKVEKPEKFEKSEKTSKSEEPAAAAAKDPVAVKPPFAAALSERPATGGRKLWALFGGLGMLALAGGTFYYLKSGAPASSTASLNAGFQLKAERSNGQIRVSWNRDAKAIRSAHNAVLSISDGSKTEDVPLDPTQLLAGSIMYSPLSTDVAFRLEVKDGTSDAGHSESIRVPPAAMPEAGSAAPAASSASKPAPAAAAPQTPQTPAPANGAARTQTPAATPAPAEAQRSAVSPPAPVPAPAPVKSFSLAARVSPPPSSSDLPEAPSVEAAGGVVVVRPSAPSRLPAPPPPPPVQAQTPPPAAPPQAAAPAPKSSGGKVQEARLLRRVDAVYPPMARQARVSGVVRMQATIGKDGKVRKVEVLSGPPLLKQAAIDAVQKWVYSPSLLNGAAVESATEVDVAFNLGSR